MQNMIIDENTLSETTIKSNQDVISLEERILNSIAPIEVDSNENINLNGISGIWVNKNESSDLSSVQEDDEPTVIKKPSKTIDLKQKISVKYLKPPPVDVGDLVIRQLPDVHEPALPPLIIRQEGKKADEPSRLIIREEPPKRPDSIPEKVITIPGKTIPAPPRKVIVEKLADEPSIPDEIIIEKWLPYEKTIRKIRYEKSEPILQENPRNMIIIWDAPSIEVERQLNCVGVFDAGPNEYTNPTPECTQDSYYLELAKEAVQAYEQDHPPPVNKHPRLEGDIDALALVDLEKEGLNEYKYILDNVNRKTSQRSTINNSVYSVFY